MKKIKLFWTYVMLIFLLISCSDDENIIVTSCNTISGTVKIMPLGASRVQGFRPIFESYRYALWEELIDGDWRVDYVGTQQDVAKYENYAGYCFDNDHEGRSGWTSEQIKNNIADWLAEVDEIDIVLFSSPGGNDAINGVPIENILQNVNLIIDEIQMHNPNITILIEKMAPAKSSYMTENLTEIFEQMKVEVDEFARIKTTATSKVIAVDMFTGFTDAYLADILHYNTDGARFIADRYYESLVPYLE
jgi:lysophospholipase L1-like esterase